MVRRGLLTGPVAPSTSRARFFLAFLRRDEAAVLLALVVALSVRLWQIDLSHFDIDQVILLANAEAFIDSGRIPWTSGLSFTIGVRHPPLVTFILAAPMVVSRDPVWVSAFQASVDALSVVFLFLVGRDLAGRWAGVAAGLLYAVAPGPVVYSRQIWNPDLVPFFSAVGLWGAVGFSRFGDARRLAAAGFAIGCAVQLHLSAAVFLPLLVALALVRRRDLRWRPLGLAGTLLGLVLAPYAMLQVTSGWADVQAAVAYLLTPKHFAAEVPSVALSLVSGDFRRQVTTQSLPVSSVVAQALALGLLVLGSVVALRRRAGWLLLVWLELPGLAALRSPELVQPHYLLALLPAAVALGGIGVTAVKPDLVRGALLAAVVAGGVADHVRFVEAVAALDVGFPYDRPLRYAQQATQLALALNSDSHVFFGQTGGRAYVFAYLTDDRLAMTRFDSRDSLVLRPEGGFYVTDGDGHAAQLLREEFGPPVATVKAAAKTPFAFFRLSPESVSRYLNRKAPQGLDVDVGHVVRVRGFDRSELASARPSWVMIAWDMVQPSYRGWADLRLAGHLLDDTNRRWSTNRDIQASPANDWRAGDSVLSWLDINPRADTPTGGYWLEVSFYDRSPSQRLPVYEGGREIGSAFRIGPLKVAGLPVAQLPGPELAGFGRREMGLAKHRDRRTSGHANLASAGKTGRRLHCVPARPRRRGETGGAA